eukprot:1159818-Pelagomonas_calceolata.AAC.2
MDGGAAGGLMELAAAAEVPSVGVGGEGGLDAREDNAVLGMLRAPLPAAAVAAAAAEVARGEAAKEAGWMEGAVATAVRAAGGGWCSCSSERAMISCVLESNLS